MHEFTEDQSSFDVSRWGDKIAVAYTAGPITSAYARDIADRLAAAMCRPGERVEFTGASASHGFQYVVRSD